MNSKQQANKDIAGSDSPHFCTDADTSEDVPAWTEIEQGRFMPRRVRGSNQGRALG